MVNLRLPNINGANEREKLAQMQSYLYQLVEQLQFALNTVESSTPDSPVKSQMPVRVIQSSPVAMMSLDRGLSDDQATFQAIKPLIIKSADIVNAYYEEINRRLESIYVARSDFGTFMEETSQEISETSTDITRAFSNIQTIVSEIGTIDTNVKSLATNIDTIDTTFQENIQTVEKKIEDTKTVIGSELKTVEESVGTLDTEVKSVKAGVQNVTQEVSKVDTELQGVKTGVQAVEQKAQTLEGNLETIGSNVEAIGSNVQEIETDLQDTKVGIDSTVKQLSDEVGVIDNDLQGVKAGVESGIKDLSDEVGKVDSRLEDAKNAIASDIDKLKDTLDTLNSIIVEVNAKIKTGLIDYDDNGIPIYGLEIGQKNTINGVEVFNKFARFSAGRLSFYDNNGTEVAYISDYKLYITHAEVTGTLKLGGYLVDTSKGVTFKWVGRS